MPDFLVLTVIADDKPGTVEKLSSVIADHHGNWLESRMAQMAGNAVTFSLFFSIEMVVWRGCCGVVV